MKICYIPKRFSQESLETIRVSNEILEDYAAQGYDLTLRQLYYQHVSKGLIPNQDSEYKKLGSVINDARLAGMVDWDHITDRTRNLRASPHWDSPRDIVEACASQFRLDKWASQANYVECWVEKDALVGVLEVACSPLDVSYFSCRGYTSQSEIWAASQRLLAKVRLGKRVVVIHLGDHDPSGIDMSRDIQDRITLFMRHHRFRDFMKANPREDNESHEDWGARTEALMLENASVHSPFTLNRIALNMDQVLQYAPPPNPAKITDSRSTKYIREFGDESWELDALEPKVLTKLIQDAILELRDEDLWDQSIADEDLAKARLIKAAKTL
jgi:hypothetical protein